MRGRGRRTYRRQQVSGESHLQVERAAFSHCSVTEEVYLGLIEKENNIMWVSATGKITNLCNMKMDLQVPSLHNVKSFQLIIILGTKSHCNTEVLCLFTSAKPVFAVN